MTEASTTGLLPPGEDLILSYAKAALAEFPAPIRDLAAEVALVIADFPSDEMLAELGIKDPFELTGLYEGTPLTEKSVTDPAPRPDTVWLFRRPILEEWIERGDVPLAELVAHVTIHEFAHHFGWSDDEIAKIAPWDD